LPASAAAAAVHSGVVYVPVSDMPPIQICLAWDAGRGVLGDANGGVEVTDEGDVRVRRPRLRIVGKHDRRTVPRAAEGALGVGALVRIVAGEGALADEQHADARDEVVDLGVRGTHVLGQPRHVAIDAGDEAVEGHGGHVQQLAHPGLLCS
jgi:hypothetical protein